MRHLPLVFVVFLSSCLCSSNPTSRLSSGTYVGNGATLQVDVTAKTATLTPNGGTATALTLTALPEASWPMDCPTNYVITTLETFTVSPDPITVSGTSVSTPWLTAGCGINGADPDAVQLMSSTRTPKFVFRK